MKGNLLWLVYKKLRPALGIPFAFVLISGAFLGILNLQIITLAFGLFFIDLFGNFYNDYCDFAEDVRNKRKDKFTTCGVIRQKTTLHISIGMIITGFIILFNTHTFFLLFGILLAFLLFAYSHKALRLKGKLFGYAMSFPYFILPLLIAFVFDTHTKNALALGLFFYFQCMYVLCQKDSTDTKDESNLFISKGWNLSFKITTFFAVLSNVSLLYLSTTNISLLPAWILNTFAKAGNLKHIRVRTITRNQRSNYILAEFLSHYLFVVCILI